MEMEVEVCHRVNGPFFSPFSSFFFFFVFLFLLPGRLVSWPSGLHGCISLGHEPLSFCRALSLSSPPATSYTSPSSFCSAFLRSCQGRYADPLEQKLFLLSEISLVNELSDILHVSWFTTIPVNRFAIRGDTKFESAVRTGVSLNILQSILFYRKVKKNEIFLLKFKLKFRWAR